MSSGSLGSAELRERIREAILNAIEGSLQEPQAGQLTPKQLGYVADAVLAVLPAGGDGERDPSARPSVMGPGAPPAEVVNAIAIVADWTGAGEGGDYESIAVVRAWLGDRRG